MHVGGGVDASRRFGILIMQLPTSRENQWVLQSGRRRATQTAGCPSLLVHMSGCPRGCLLPGVTSFGRITTVRRESAPPETKWLRTLLPAGPQWRTPLGSSLGRDLAKPNSPLILSVATQYVNHTPVVRASGSYSRGLQRFSAPHFASLDHPLHPLHPLQPVGTARGAVGAALARTRAPSPTSHVRSVNPAVGRARCGRGNAGSAGSAPSALRSRVQSRAGIFR
jgi:hypothetical protein